MKEYKSFVVHIQASPNPKGEGGSIVHWTLEYERLYDAITHPETLLQFVVDKTFEFEQVIDIVRVSLELWANANWSQLNTIDVFRNPNEIVVKSAKAGVKRITQWQKPCFEVVKFIDDGSSRGKLSPAGISGVLRNFMGNELIRFSKTIEIEDSKAAAYLAIREPLLIFISSPWVQSMKLCIESDSMKIVR
ncbi:hypothetical protein PTKIN_Ptkin17bG0112900 [Pterospermum kingtungense]